MKIDLTCPVEMWRYDLPQKDYDACNLTLYNLSDKVITSVEVTLILTAGDGEESAKIVHRGRMLNGVPGRSFRMVVPLEARTAGIGFEELCERMIQLALQRKDRKQNTL